MSAAEGKRNMKFLIVDDSRAMRSLVRRALRQAGITVSEAKEAGDGAEALQILADYAPDVILSDWNMPNMTGIELLRSLRGAGWETPFFLVTSEGTEEKRAEAKEAGANGLLAKPFEAEDFEAIKAA